MEIDGFVLAGGSGSRLGTPKAHVLIGEASLLDRAVLALRSICSSVRIAGQLEGVSGIELVPDDPVIIDGKRVSASIIGLHTAIAAAKTEWVAVLACDLPFVTETVFETMLERLMNAGPEHYDVIVIEQAEGRLQPLVGIYRRQAALDAVVEAIAARELSLHRLLNKLRLLRLSAGTFGDLSAQVFMNVNTKADLDRARSALRSE